MPPYGSTLPTTTAHFRCSRHTHHGGSTTPARCPFICCVPTLPDTAHCVCAGAAPPAYLGRGAVAFTYHTFCRFCPGLPHAAASTPDGRYRRPCRVLPTWAPRVLLVAGACYMRVWCCRFAAARAYRAAVLLPHRCLPPPRIFVLRGVRKTTVPRALPRALLFLLWFLDRTFLRARFAHCRAFVRAAVLPDARGHLSFWFTYRFPTDTPCLLPRFHGSYLLPLPVGAVPPPRLLRCCLPLLFVHPFSFSFI